MIPTRTRIRLFWFSALALAASGCSFDTSGIPQVDDGSIDAPTPPDAPIPPDGMPIDAMPIDAMIPDAMPPDAMPPDAMVPPGPVVVSYWRMEVDTDLGADVSVPNEIPGRMPLTAPMPAILSTNTPVATIPRTLQPNVNALAHGASQNLRGAVAYDDRLDVTSIGIEFWARTTEGQAAFFDRSINFPNDGLRIDNPDNVRVRYHVDNGAGGALRREILSGHDMDDTWRHYAFIYDEATGMGCLYVDGVLTGTCDAGTPNRPLVWAPSTPIRIGNDMDGGNMVDPAVIDELRIWDGAPDVADLLISQP